VKGRRGKKISEVADMDEGWEGVGEEERAIIVRDNYQKPLISLM